MFVPCNIGAARIVPCLLEGVHYLATKRVIKKYDLMHTCQVMAEPNYTLKGERKIHTHWFDLKGERTKGQTEN